MILYYAIGGGLGHLTRMRAVAHTLGITEDVTILTASQAALDPRINGGFNVHLVPPELAESHTEYREWLHAAIDQIAPGTIFIDTFPAGIIGEFCDFTFPTDIPLIHIARLLRWKEYAAVLHGNAPRFTQTWCVEPLTGGHEHFLQSQSDRMDLLELVDPMATEVIEGTARLEPGGPGGISDILHADNRPLWLVVHSGPAEEIEELLAYARERAALESSQPRIVLISPTVVSGVERFDLYPATPLFPLAERIITACGFNIMRQLAPWRTKQWFVPMPRRYDDQFLRGSRAQGETAPPAIRLQL
jgi:hypothetical protein